MTNSNRTYFFFRLIVVFFLFVSNRMSAQLDSINSVVNKEKNSSNKIHLLLNNSIKFSGKEVGLILARKAYHLSELNRDNDLIAQSASQISLELFNLNKTDSILYYQEIAIKKFREVNNNIGLFDVLIKKFRFLRTKGKQEQAFELYNELIKLTEKLDDPIKTALLYYNMGSLFADISNAEKAITYYDKALKLYSKSSDWKGVSTCYLMLGHQNFFKGFYDMSIEYLERGLDIDSKKNNNQKRADFLLAIGNVYYSLNNYEKSLYYYKEALAFNSNTENKNVMVLKSNIGVSLLELKRFNEAKPYLIEVYFSDCPPRDKADYASNLSAIYQQLGDYEAAMNYMEVYTRLNDSLNEDLYQKKLSETEAKYTNEKQEEQNILLAERLKNKSRQMYFALSGILLLIGLAFFIFRGLRQQSKANKALADKNKIIEEKSMIVEEQHKDITDSIKYAERIQKAILPPDKLWQSILPESFVFYQPKDILSGDFYWIEETEEYIFIAAADCTGHGVPGALMSIVNYNLLNKAVLEQGLTKASEILGGVNKWLTIALHQTYQESAVRDGMDVSLCVINKSSKQLNYAGAFNSIYIVNRDNIKELVPDKQPVGAFIEDNIKDFTDKYYQLTEHDTVYMFTDGYADQFGGDKGKKYKYRNLQQLLIENHQKSFEEQKNVVSKTINIWKGNLEQIDDMLLIGYKIT